MRHSVLSVPHSLPIVLVVGEHDSDERHGPPRRYADVPRTEIPETLVAIGGIDHVLTDVLGFLPFGPGRRADNVAEQARRQTRRTRRRRPPMWAGSNQRETCIGLTLPFEGLSLDRAPRLLARAEALGYQEAWSSERNGFDAFTPLAAAAVVTSRLRLGVSVASAFTRPPGLLAMSAA